jgi:hypothetical protein
VKFYIPYFGIIKANSKICKGMSSPVWFKYHSFQYWSVSPLLGFFLYKSLDKSSIHNPVSSYWPTNWVLVLPSLGPYKVQVVPALWFGKSPDGGPTNPWCRYQTMKCQRIQNEDPRQWLSMLTWKHEEAKSKTTPIKIKENGWLAAKVKETWKKKPIYTSWLR